MANTPWQATFVRRWHTNQHLCNTIDPVGAHSARMAVLCLQFFPDDFEVLAGCITHDLGETASGDIPWGAKNKWAADGVAENWERDNKMTAHWYLDGDQYDRLKFLDMMDAYLWAKHHAPEMVKKSIEWQDQLKNLLTYADENGIDVSGYMEPQK